MNLEAGKYYRTRDGRKVGPIVRTEWAGIFAGHCEGKTYVWMRNGVHGDSATDDPCIPNIPENDLISEWTDIDLSNPLGIVFGLMPPEAQEAMVAARSPDTTIERFYSEWVPEYSPIFHDSFAYRVKPAPKVETVVLTGGESNGWGFYADGGVSNAFSITFNLIDGKPDCASIKMEKL